MAKLQAMDNNMNSVYLGGGGGSGGIGGSGGMGGYGAGGGAAAGGMPAGYHHNGTRIPPHSPATPRKSTCTAPVSNAMRYREQPISRSPPRAQTSLTSLLDDFERPTSPPDGAGGYGDDRIHNDLLEEICSDIGIKDTMDLDFLDFDGPDVPYFTKFSEEGDAFDQTIPFGQMQSQLQYGSKEYMSERMPQPNGRQHQANMGSGGQRGNMGPGPSSTVSSRHTNNGESIASPTVSSTSSGSKSDGAESARPCSREPVDSPAMVHSTTHNRGMLPPGSVESQVASSPLDANHDMGKLKSSRASSFDSLVDSPVTVIEADTKDRGKIVPDVINLDDIIPSPRPPSRQNQVVPNDDGRPAEKRLARTAAAMPSPRKPLHHFSHENLHTSKASCNLTKTESSSCSNLYGGNQYGNMSMPGRKPLQSPSVGTSVSMAGMSSSMTNITTKCSMSSPSIKKEPDDGRRSRPSSVDPENAETCYSKLSSEGMRHRSTDSPYDQGYSTGSCATSVCTGSQGSHGSHGSQFGSTNSLDRANNHAQPDCHYQDKLGRYMRGQQLPSGVPNFIPPTPISQAASARVPSSGTSSQPDSPPQERVAKRARTINNGSDLLETVREQYSFVKGADMYAKPRYPQVPVQRSRPTPCMQQQGGVNAPGRPTSTDGGGMGMTGSGGWPQGQGQYPQPMSSCAQGASTMPAGQNSCQTPQQDMSQMAGFGGNQMQTQDTQQYNKNMYGQGMQNAQSEGFAMPNYPDRTGFGGRAPVAQSRMSCQEGRAQGMSPAQGIPPTQGYQNAQQGNMQCAQQYPPQSPYANMNGQPTQRLSQPQGMSVNGMTPSDCNGGQWQQQPNLDQSGMYGNVESKGMGGEGCGGMGMAGQAHGGQYGQMAGQPGMYPMTPGQRQAPNLAQPAQQMPGRGIMPGQMGSSTHPGPASCMDPSGQPPITSQELIRDIAQPQRSQGPGMMQQLMTDRSSAFRSHPLFPLLRDLIIADMNFHSPSFPFALIANLPPDFDKLLQNYLNRNPPQQNYQGNPAVQNVIMDALKYAHKALIEKIHSRKQHEGYKDPPKPLSAIEDFCERFDKAVRNTLPEGQEGSPSQPPPQPLTDRTGPGQHNVMQYGGPMMPLKPSNSAPTENAMPRPHSHGSSSLPSTPSKQKPSSSSSSKPSDQSSKQAGPAKNKVLPKEAVAVMLAWLREHQDNPYPNDDEKEMLISKTKLSINQINYWFTNARRRILPKWALQRYMEQQQQQQQYAAQMHLMGSHH